MFQIDRFGRQPIYEQIIDQVEQLIGSGALSPGDQLPSVRSLSQTLSANPNTLQKAYTELERRGVTVSVPGSGRFISKDAPRLVIEGMQSFLDEITALSAKLCLSRVPKESVLQAVNTAYEANANGNQPQDQSAQGPTE
ncbi:MAG TPA: GntR family transcriptional regulator [Candidatus Limiplasma sp.]|nr:GntR family transcriptional regulator [Candidatus Limiplasma sp.]HPR79300.1 GntR family transcriptional regulator [Candidatus Limiplasma sp.]